MHVPAPPPPLSLARVHRLLRPLRASLHALSVNLDQHTTRVSAAAALVKVPSREGKPRSRNSLGSDDEEYAERSGQRRKKLRVGVAVGKVPLPAQQSKHPISSSSPAVSRVEEFSAEDRGLRRTSNESTNTVTSTTSQRPSQARRKARTAEGAFDLATDLRTQGFPPEVINKCTQLARALLNILYLLYPPISAKPASFSNKARSTTPAARNPALPRTVPPLGELCARQIGWAIEHNVRLCLEEAVEAKEDAEEEALERDRAQRRRRERDSDRGARRRSMRSDSPPQGSQSQVGSKLVEEDAGAFQDEWYEACPPHATRHVLVEHGLCILLEGLVELPFAIVLAFFDLVLSLGATVEATRFVGPLCATALAAPQTALSAHALSLRVVEATRHSATFFDALESTLLQSSFADRLFYTPILSLMHVHLSKSSPSLARSASHLAQLLALQVRVGHTMLEAVQAARDAGERGGEGIMREIAHKVTKEILAAVPTLVRAGGKVVGRVDGMEELREVVFAVVDEFADFLEAVVPLAAVLELEAIAKALADPDGGAKAQVVQSTLDHLAILDSIALETGTDVESGPADRQQAAEELLSRLPCLLRSLTSADFFAVSQTLGSDGLGAIEAALLERVLDGYDKLVDVKAARGAQVVSIEAIEARLRLATRQQHDQLGTPARAHAHLHKDHSSPADVGAVRRSSPLLAHSSLAGQSSAASRGWLEQQTPSKARRPAPAKLTARRAGTVIEVDESEGEDEGEGEDDYDDEEEEQFMLDGSLSPVDLTLTASEGGESVTDDEQHRTPSPARTIPSSPTPSRHSNALSSITFDSGPELDEASDSSSELDVRPTPRSIRTLSPPTKLDRRASMPVPQVTVHQQPAAHSNVLKPRRSEPVSARDARWSVKRRVAIPTGESSEDELLLS